MSPVSERRPTYWKSLARLADEPRARAFMEREFPEHASELPEGVSRRTMLMLLGASLSLAGLAGCRRPVETIVPYVNAPEEIIPGIPLHYATTMPLGRHAYGLVVESHEGRPTKIEGNELHPSTAGSSSSWMQAAILGLYDPDRSQTVRHGEEKKSWADFVAAWKELEATHLENGGAGLAVLSGAFASPSLARLRRAFHERFPAARWVVFEPNDQRSQDEGLERATGVAYQPVHHFERASVILSLDCDFLLTEGESVREARGFADGRRISSPSDSMNRLWVVESGLSLTGSNADHRLRLRGSQVAAFLAGLHQALAAKLGLPDQGSAPALPDVDPSWTRVLAEDLVAHRGRSLIVAGRNQPAEVHAAVFALNRALGSIGTTVTYHEQVDTARPKRGDLAELVQSMAAGSVSTLVMLGGNPVYDAPVDLDFAAALEQAAEVVHLSPYVDETSLRATWHLPQAHFLEAWGDARAVDGTPSVIQPLIQPLYGGRSHLELLGLLATGEETPGHDLVRESWRPVLGEIDFEKSWRRVLHDGLLRDGALPAIEPRASVSPIFPELYSRARAAASAAGGLEIDFRVSPAVFDGRFANNGWLLELPDPVTKLTWDNAACVSPATARELGLEKEQVVRLSYGGRSLEAPIWIVPGQADGTVRLELGYGRQAAGRIGNGRGVNAYALRTSAAPDFDGGLQLAATGATYPLSETQDHFTVDELGIEVSAQRVPTLIREATLDEYKHHPEFAKEMIEFPPLKSMWEEHSYEEGYQWGMSIDLNACTGCNACVVACQSENNIPIVGKEQVRAGREMHWIRIDRYFRGEIEDPETVFQPVPCMQCENAPCEQVCPVAATVHDAEGVNTMVYNRCIGTRYCLNNCPYKVRRFNFFNYTKDTPEIRKMASNPDVTVRSRGVMEKCTYCTQRINAAKIDAKLQGREVRDGEIQTACQQACPSQAIVFGNIRDPESRVSQLKRQQRDYTLLEEMNNKPRTTYLAKLRNPHPELAG